LAEHREASRKKTIRIEALRSSMGREAFDEMVDRQLTRRRNRIHDAGGPEPLSSQWQQTQRWWQSPEGRMYWRGPKEPPSGLVKDALEWEPSGLSARAWAWIRSALRGPATVERIELGVPPQSVARWAATAANWSLGQQVGGHRCRCSVVLALAFNVAAGERVPRMYVTGGVRFGSMKLLDAASLQCPHGGETLRSVRRLVEVGGRVVALTGREAVALALPRPHDTYDAVLRGRRPATSRLPVGWDVTEAAASAEVRVAWSSAELHVTLVGSDSVQDAEVFAQLARALELHHAASNDLFLERTRHRRRLVSWAWHACAKTGRGGWVWILRPSWECIQGLARAALPHLRHAWQVVRSWLLEAGCAWLRWAYAELYTRLLLPAAERLRWAGAELCERLVLPAGRWVGQLRRHACALLMPPLRRTSQRLADSWVAAMQTLERRVWQPMGRLLGAAVEACARRLRLLSLQLHIRASSAFAQAAAWWRSEPWLRSALRHVSSATSAFCVRVHRRLLAPLGSSCDRCLAAAKRRLGAAASRLSARWRRAPAVNLARARRHEVHHGLG